MLVKISKETRFLEETGFLFTSKVFDYSGFLSY